ncbi:MAG: DinB family protein [Planctomycetes bacterium]|nr:DinB family protein [Planctomycetota bacterium]
MYPNLTSRGDTLKMLDEMIETRQKILDLCGRLTVEQLNDPVYPGTWSVLKNLAHLASSELFMMAYIKSRPGPAAKESLPKEPAQELAVVRVALDEAHADAIAFLKANPESVLAEPCVFGRALVPQTVGGLYFHIIEHEIGHRTFILHKLAKLQGK